MKVRTFNSVPLLLNNPKELLEKIKREGTVREAFDGSASESVLGMYFLIGGRLRIEKLLSTSSGGAFVGDDLTVHMIRLNRKKLSKTSTIVCIAPARVWRAAGADGRWKKVNFAGDKGSIPYSKVIDGLWGGEAKALNDIFGEAGI